MKNENNFLRMYMNEYRIYLYIYLFIIYILLYNNRRKLITVKGPFMGRQVTIVSNHVNNLHKSTK